MTLFNINNFNFINRIKNIEIENIFKYAFVIILGFSLALTVNSLLEYKFFVIPKENIKVINKRKHKKKDVINYAKYIFNYPPKKYPMSKSETFSIRSKLNSYKLVGIFFMGKSKVAIIKYRNRFVVLKEKKDLDGLTLKKVHKFYIILTDGNNDYKIFLEKRVKFFHRRNSNQINNLNDYTQNSNLGTLYKVKLSEINYIMKNYSNLLSDINTVPYISEDNSVKGLKITKLKSDSILAKYGLKEGDILISINNRKITNMGDVYRIFKYSKNLKSLDIKILRDNREINLRYILN